MKKSIFSLLILLGMLTQLKAQTVMWQMLPSEYDGLERINTNLYKISRNNKLGLIHADGTEVAPLIIDHIYGFYEHKALVACNDGHGERILGYLTDNGKYNGFSAKYYTLNGQKFYSDGLLSVADESGNLGYIDQSGNKMIGFDGKYTKIKPFVEGYAVVIKGKKFYLIDKDGTPVHFTFKTIGEVFSITNAYNGSVYVMDTDGKFYTFDIERQGVCKKAKKPKDTRFDYLYRYISTTGNPKEVPYETKISSGRKGLNPTSLGGQFGYTNGEVVVLPCQFASATQFEDGYAVVSLNGKKGILKYVEDNAFCANVSETHHNFYAGSTVKCKFNLVVPGVWQDKVKVTLKNSNGTVYRPSNNSDGYSFAIKPAQTEQQSFMLIVEGEGLKLFEGKLEYSFTRKERCSICGKDTDKCAYKGNHPRCNVCGKVKEKCTGHGATPKPVEKCPTCKKPIKDCPKKGFH